MRDHAVPPRLASSGTSPSGHLCSTGNGVSRSPYSPAANAGFRGHARGWFSAGAAGAGSQSWALALPGGAGTVYSSRSSRLGDRLAGLYAGMSEKARGGKPVTRCNSDNACRSNGNEGVFFFAKNARKTGISTSKSIRTKVFVLGETNDSS